MVYINYQEAIYTIIAEGKQADAIQLLSRSIQTTMDKLEKQNSEMSACLRAIKKINQGKNEAIGNLCEQED